MKPITTSIWTAWFDTPAQPIPWLRWVALGFVAVAGSLLYGASLSLVLPGWESWSAAVWLALSAGIAWCVLIPVLCRVGRVAWVPCCDACLLTMAVGEGVLVSGALLNTLLWMACGSVHAAAINGVVVGISNVVMASVLAHRLRLHGVPPRRTWAAWMLALNGSGAVFFFIFYLWLRPA